MTDSSLREWSKQEWKLLKTCGSRRITQGFTGIQRDSQGSSLKDKDSQVSPLNDRDSQGSSLNLEWQGFTGIFLEPWMTGIYRDLPWRTGIHRDLPWGTDSQGSSQFRQDRTFPIFSLFEKIKKFSNPKTFLAKKSRNGLKLNLWKFRQDRTTFRTFLEKKCLKFYEIKNPHIQKLFL